MTHPIIIFIKYFFYIIFLDKNEALVQIGPFNGTTILCLHQVGYWRFATI